MKTRSTIILSFLALNLFSTELIEKKVTSEVNEVTVFLKGAQITRIKSVEVPAGESILKFTDLSPYIDAKSVRVKANGALTVLSVNHHQHYPDGKRKSTQLKTLRASLQEKKEAVELENTRLSIIAEELDFLKLIRKVGDDNTGFNMEEFKLASEFFGERLGVLKLKEIERRKTLQTRMKEEAEIQSEINMLENYKELPSGEVHVKIQAKTTGKINLELRYVVGNVSWYPTYDIRARSINEPIKIIYKANVHQDTRVDWKNVKLRFSSSDPNISGVAPVLRTYFLNYDSNPANNGSSITQVNGRVYDENGEGLPGVNVLVKGTTFGTVTDMQGNYSIMVPANSEQLVYSFLGYLSEEVAINSPTINVQLTEDIVSLDEIVVVGYGTSKRAAMTGAISGLNIRGTNSIRPVKNIPATIISTNQKVMQTTVDFEIDIPYSIASDNQNYTINMEEYELPAYYEYYCVPKLNKDVFLIANITAWEKFNLLQGEANLFFEDTYVGKSILDVRYAADTLQLSLGRDRNVSVQREKQKDYTSRRFIGNKKEEVRDYLISIKNNKTEAINMVVLDQVPVSTLDEIEVETKHLGQARKDEMSGELRWIFKLDPTDKRELRFGYAVKYPKYRNLLIE